MGDIRLRFSKYDLPQNEATPVEHIRILVSVFTSVINCRCCKVEGASSTIEIRVVVVHDTVAVDTTFHQHLKRQFEVHIHMILDQSHHLVDTRVYLQ